ncbi:MAG: alkaline phosphatase D family protein, partial [Myxococcales bacterium]|nr:alkaline phosphatase D family protein [Myxococcales bacterium]
LGDYVYETTGDPSFQTTSPGRLVEFTDLGGAIELEEDGEVFYAASSLSNYRELYKIYRGDVWLQRVHERYPMIVIWDDHEFADDCWQDHATHFNEAQGDEQNTARRTAANQAWFEFIPVDLERDAGASFPDDLRIYRSLRFGKHAELVLTDLRSYRSDHVIPEGPIDFLLGKFEEYTAIGARQFVQKSQFDPREAESGVTMLGGPQKQWLLDTLRASTATWKLWGSEVMNTQLLVDLSRFESLPENFRDTFYFTLDQWDGYRTERAEVMQALEEVGNVVVLVGDIHAHYASELHVDFDNPGDRPAAVEFVCPGISSQALQNITVQTLEGNQTLSDLGLVDIAREFDREVYMANPHIKFTDNLANGYLRVDLSAAEVQATWVTVPDVTDEAMTGDVVRTVRRTAAGSNRITE